MGVLGQNWVTREKLGESYRIYTIHYIPYIIALKNSKVTSPAICRYPPVQPWGFRNIAACLRVGAHGPTLAVMVSALEGRWMLEDGEGNTSFALISADLEVTFVDDPVTWREKAALT